MIKFLIGLFIGAFIGIAIMCLIIMGKDDNYEQ